MGLGPSVAEGEMVRVYTSRVAQCSMQAPLHDWMVAWAGDFELDPSSREGLSGPNTNQIRTGRSLRRRQTLRVDASLLQWRA